MIKKSRGNVPKWQKLVPDAEGWHVPKKQDAIKYIPKDIEVINWYWMWYTPGDDEFKENGIDFCYSG